MSSFLISTKTNIDGNASHLSIQRRKITALYTQAGRAHGHVPVASLLTGGTPRRCAWRRSGRITRCASRKCCAASKWRSRIRLVTPTRRTLTPFFTLLRRITTRQFGRSYLDNPPHGVLLPLPRRRGARPSPLPVRAGLPLQWENV